MASDAPLGADELPGPPPFRIEHHAPEEAALIVGYADTLPIGQARLVRAAVRLLRERATGEVVLVDQDTERVIERRSL